MAGRSSPWCWVLGVVLLAFNWPGAVTAQTPESSIGLPSSTAPDLHRRYLIGGAVLLAVQSAFMAALLVQRARRRRAEQALRESEERFHLMADTAPVLVRRSDSHKLCDFFNRPWLEFTGRTMEQELGNGWSEGIFPDDLDRCLSTYVSAFDARKPFRMEYRLRRADGAYRWVLDTGVPRYSSDGSFAGYIGSCIDITERREIEQALSDSQARYHLAAAAGAVGVWDWNLETNEFFQDPNLKSILGFDAAEIPDHVNDWKARVFPDDLEAVTTHVRACLSGRTDAFSLELRIVHKDGSLRWFLTRGTVMRDASGKPHRAVGTSVDITDQKRSADQFRLAIEAAPAGMLMVDRSGTIVLVNAHIERLFGYEREELLNRSIDQLVPERFRANHPAYRDEYSRNPVARLMGEGRPLYALCKNGSEIPIEIGLNPLRTPEGDFVLASVADITERKRAERESADLMDQLQDLAGSLIKAQEFERARLGRDLHDDVSQQLAGLSIALSGLKRRVGTLSSDGGLEGDVAAIQQRAVALAENVRSLSHDLHPALLQHVGLVAALSAHCSEARRDQNVAVSVNAEGDFESMDSATALCLYRVTQEALRNVFKHAEAKHADVRLVGRGDTAELTIKDDGKGFDVVRKRWRGGLGLVSIRERVRLAGGTVSLVTELNKGTRVTVRVPLSPLSKHGIGAPIGPGVHLT